MRKLFIPVCAAAVLALMVAPPAEAASVLRLTQGASVETIVDNGAGDTSNTIDGLITFNGTVGTFSINVSTGLTRPQIGSSTFPKLDLASVDGSMSSGGTLKIEFTHDGFSFGLNPAPFQFDVGGTTNGSVSFKLFAGATDFDQAHQVGDTLAFNSSPFAGTTKGQVPFPADSSLTIVAEITHGSSTLATGAGNLLLTSFDAEVTPLPEPGSLALFGTALLGLGFVAHRRRRRA